MTRKLMLVAIIALLVCTGLGSKYEASCTTPATEWRLTISSTEGGSVTAPGEGMFWYDDGEVVDLEATPADGYRFVNWTGRVYTIDSLSRRITKIHMTLDYTITANFAPIGAG